MEQINGGTWEIRKKVNVTINLAKDRENKEEIKRVKGPEER